MNRVRCPICGKEAELRQTGDWPDFPFCSRRCRIIDLGRWLDERYAVPDRSASPEESDQPDEVP